MTVLSVLTLLRCTAVAYNIALVDYLVFVIIHGYYIRNPYLLCCHMPLFHLLPAFMIHLIILSINARMNQLGNGY